MKQAQGNELDKYRAKRGTDERSPREGIAKKPFAFHATGQQKQQTLRQATITTQLKQQGEKTQRDEEQEDCDGNNNDKTEGETRRAKLDELERKEKQYEADLAEEKRLREEKKARVRQQMKEKRQQKVRAELERVNGELEAKQRRAQGQVHDPRR